MEMGNEFELLLDDAQRMKWMELKADIADPGIKIAEGMYISNTGIIFRKVFKSPETMPPETKSFVYTDVGGIRASVYEGCVRIGDTYIMPEITDVSVKNDRVVFVTFADGTKEKAVLSANDEFSLEQGISICVTKKLLSATTANNGSAIYNKIIDKGLKVFNNKQKQEETAKLDEQKKRAKINKLKAKKVRKANAAREAQIEIQKEAYLRAMREFNGTSTNAPCFDVAEL